MFRSACRSVFNVFFVPRLSRTFDAAGNVFGYRQPTRATADEDLILCLTLRTF